MGSVSRTDLPGCTRQSRRRRPPAGLALTCRQREILVLVSKGQTTTQISTILGLAEPPSKRSPGGADLKGRQGARRR